MTEDKPIGLLIQAYHYSSFSLVASVVGAIHAAKSHWEYSNGYVTEISNPDFRERFGKGGYGHFGDRRRPAEPEINNCGYYKYWKGLLTVVHNVKRPGCVMMHCDSNAGVTNCFVGPVEQTLAVTLHEYKQLTELSGWFVERVLYHFSSQISRLVVLPSQSKHPW